MVVRVIEHLLDESIVVTVCTLAFLIGSHTIAEGRDEPADALPRYRFKVGQELVYQLTSRDDPREKGANVSAALDQMEWRIFVVRRNDDGSWRLFIRTNITFITTEGKVRARRHSLGYCDVRPDGSYTLDEQTAVTKRLLPHELFCRLPHRSSELTKGWRYEPPVERLSYDFGPASREGKTLQIHGVTNTPYQQMHRWETTKQYDFDLERGLVKRIVWEWGADGLVRDRRTIELKSVVKRDAAWISQFHAEANDYLAAFIEWVSLLNEAAWAHSAAASEPTLRRARALLVAARDKAELEILQGIYDANIREHDEHNKWATSDAAKREAFFAEVPKFATDWRAQNFDGSMFRLTDHRGKIVVLDFWGTNCEYCVLMAPQVTRLAAEYQGKKVVFLGMFDRRESDDQEEARARSLIESVYKGISHLEAKEIVEHYRLAKFGLAYPALLILDQSGVVREAHIGYTADLPQRLRTIIDAMLSKAVDAR